MIGHLDFKAGDGRGILTVRRPGEARRRRPERTFVEPSRRLREFAETQVLVIGVRHARRLRGVRPVERSGWQAGVVFDDEVGVSPSLSPAFPAVSVPYGSLVPCALDGLLAPGRHMASDASSHTFLREIPQCWMTGQAAGAAAALASRNGVAPRQVEVGALQHELLRQGVYLQWLTASTTR
jgi:hypothetical protein